MKLCSRLSVVFGQNFCEKRQVWVSEPNFLEVRSDARLYIVDGFLESSWSTLYSLIELFAVCYGFGVMRRNVYRSAVFTGDRPLSTQILPGLGRPPSTILGIRKLETLEYPILEDRIPLRSLVLTQYRSVTDRQTDGRTDIRICRSMQHLQSYVLRSAVKVISDRRSLTKACERAWCVVHCML